MNNLRQQKYEWRHQQKDYKAGQSGRDVEVKPEKAKPGRREPTIQNRVTGRDDSICCTERQRSDRSSPIPDEHDRYDGSEYISRGSQVGVGKRVHASGGYARPGDGLQAV